MRILNWILLLFFVVIVVLGVVFSVEVGVFVGFAFAAWQLYKLGYRGHKYHIFVWITIVLGTYFLISLDSSFLSLILFWLLSVLNLGKFYLGFLVKEDMEENMEEETE